MANLEAFARTRVVMVSLVPFRSPSEDQLHRREESLAFGRELWRDVFTDWKPQAAVMFDGTPFDELSGLLGRVVREQRFDSGWKRTKITLREFGDGSRLLGLPYLSSFTIGSKGIAAAFDALMSGHLA
jgi:hypothetical protein